MKLKEKIKFEFNTAIEWLILVAAILFKNENKSHKNGDKSKS